MGTGILGIIEGIQNLKAQRALQKAQAEMTTIALDKAKAHADYLKKLPEDERNFIMGGGKPEDFQKSQLAGQISGIMSQVMDRESARSQWPEPIPPGPGFSGMNIPLPRAIAEYQAQQASGGGGTPMDAARSQFEAAGISDVPGLFKSTTGIDIFEPKETKTMGDKVVTVGLKSGKRYGEQPRDRFEMIDVLTPEGGKVAKRYNIGRGRFEGGEGIPTAPIPPQSSETAAKGSLMEGARDALSELMNLIKDDKGNYKANVLKSMAPLGNRNFPLSTSPAIPGPLAKMVGMAPEGELAMRKYLRVVEGKVRPESGAAVPPEEISRLHNRYMPKWWLAGTPEGTKELDASFRDLENFLNSTIQKVDPNSFYDYQRRGYETYKAVNEKTGETELYAILPAGKKGLSGKPPALNKKKAEYEDEVDAYLNGLEE